MPFLRTSRSFPEDPQELRVELDRSYIDIASKVNSRSIGLYPTNRPAITGNNYFLTSAKRQTLRQIYVGVLAPPVLATDPINHGVTNVVPGQFINCFGSFTDGINTYSLIFGSNVAIAGQISFYVTATQILFLVGAGAPAVTSVLIILEWLSQP